MGHVLVMNGLLFLAQLFSCCHIWCHWKPFLESLVGSPYLDRGGGVEKFVLFYKFKFTFMLYIIKLCISLFHLIHCSGLNVCFPLQFVCWNTNHQCDGIRRLGLWEVLSHEGGTLMKGISARIKGTPEIPLILFLPWEDTMRSWLSATILVLIWTYRLQNCEQWISIVYKPPRLWYFVITAWVC